MSRVFPKTLNRLALLERKSHRHVPIRKFHQDANSNGLNNVANDVITMNTYCCCASHL